MDMSYRSKYSDAILSVMYSKTNYNAIFSTHFNGGVETMKNRFKNIFDTHKKRRGIISLCLILSLVFVSSSLVACQNSKDLSSEDTAKAFLKGFYEVNNLLLLDEINTLWDKASDEAIPPESGVGIATIPEDVLQKLADTTLKNVKDYITPDMGDTLIANRAIERNLTLASNYGYTLKLTSFNLTNKNTSKDNKVTYDYLAEAQLTYNNLDSVTQVINGNISLMKENEKWLVYGLTQITHVTPDKKYYKAEPAAIGIPQDNSFDSYLTEFSTSEELGNVTVIDSNEKLNVKYPDISKAYYELEIDVADPGNSSFEKGKNTRWLYLSSGKKGDVTHWTVEGLMTSGPPDESWWNTVIGG